MSDPDQNRLFSGILKEELQSAAQTGEMRAYKSGDVIFREGDPGDGIYVVIEGRVQVSTRVSESERKVLTRVEAGEFFGEMAILDNEPRSATAAADLDTKAYFITREDLVKVLDHSPRLAVSLLREFSLRLREFNRKYVQEVLQSERLTLVGRFARTIVHDFKNPLNIIGLAAELASMDNATVEMRQSAQKRISKQVARLSNMINELLEFTRGSQASIVLAQIDYGEFVRNCIEDLRLDLSDKNIKLAFENDPPSVKTLIDQQRLSHVFFNLINNAVDVMPGGGTIVLRFESGGQEVVTEIEDSGGGIAPEIASQIFEPFATHGKAQGTGLGLSICKKIVEDHKGTISARSNPGKGAIFSFTLPVQG